MLLLLFFILLCTSQAQQLNPCSTYGIEITNLPCYLPVPQDQTYYLNLKIPGSASFPSWVTLLLNITYPSSNELPEMQLNYNYFTYCSSQTSPTWVATGNSLPPPKISRGNSFSLNVNTDCKFAYLEATQGTSNAQRYGSILLSGTYPFNSISSPYIIVDCQQQGCQMGRTYFDQVKDLLF